MNVHSASAMDPPSPDDGITEHSGRAASRTQHVYTQLRDDIVRTRLAPGALVIETDLAARFGTSKTPIREALQVLIAEGFVLAIPRRGYVVRPLGIRDVREVLELRVMLEPPLAAAATRYATPDFIDRLGHRFDAQRAGGATAALTDAARAFHECVIDASRNVRARSVMGGLLDETTRSHYAIPALDAHLHSELENEGHERVLNAIRAGDAGAAEEAMQSHLLELRGFVLQAFLDT